MGFGASRMGGPEARTNRPNVDGVWIVTSSLSNDIGRWPDRHAPRVERRSPTPPPPPPPPPGEIQLEVQSIDLLKEMNTKHHHTDEINGLDALVIRRGQAFMLMLKLNRQYNDKTDSIIFDFQTGSFPRVQKRTRIIASLRSSSLPTEGWEVETTKVTEDTLTVSITTFPNALVGMYSLSVRTNVSDESTTAAEFRFKEPNPIYLLFNAWCKDDQVFLEKDEEKQEYILNEEGFIWYGNWRQQGRRPWNFNQFEKGVFDTVMYLLGKHVNESAWDSPVIVSRRMSAAVNSQDDRGVLSGRWDGDYKPYNRPTKWTGSQRILEEHFETKAPVRYGQCWVFAGVLTTVLRCLGIPTRSVTNFASAHDTDGSLTIDKHFNEDGEKNERYDSDSVWNFHVWSEAWMARPDLPTGFGGWQAVDATPQETSEGIYCTGPCSVSAIKQGQVFYQYDAKFVFAEVNGDVVHWEVKKNGTFELLRIKRNDVGKKISTKQVGSGDRLDITHEYKYPEGSDAERAAVKSAVDHGTKPLIYETSNSKDDVDLSIELQDSYIGADFDIIVPVTNKSSEDRTVTITVTLQVCYYTGVVAGKVKTEKKEVKLGPNESSNIKIHVEADEYLDKLVDQTAFKVFVLGHVDETGQAFGDEDDFRLRTPDLDVLLTRPAADEVRVRETFEVEIRLTNPLKKTLENCEFIIEGPGLFAHKTVKHGAIKPNDVVSETVKVTPWKAGKRTLVVIFESDQLSQVTGELELNVQPKV